MKRTTTAIILLIVSALLSACSEVSTSYYPTYEAAVKDGAVKRGWIPEIVPESATELHEEHDLDTNNVWLRFNLSNSEKSRLTAGLQKLSHQDISKTKLRYPSKADWWFEGLIQQSPANEGALNADIYTLKCYNGKNGYLAFDRVSEKVYYWCAE